MGEILELDAGDGHRFAAYVARPAGTPRGALVVVQEIFGVNSHIRGVADGYAAEGYLAIAPALFDRVQRGVELGYEGADRQRGMELKNATGNEAALRDIAAAVGAAGEAGKVGLVGYCWGGLLGWLAACELDGLSAAVSYYGGGMQEQGRLSPRCPVLAHFGERDDHIPVDRVKAFAAARPEVELHFYPAGHGFNCDQRGSFDAPSAALARQRTLDFLRRHVG
ncbi:dienelactone hydrolase family protein [Caldimonas tepidiphila]|uniref:dienelactone hydrolase family protein n=1 Tax=Caldimonas tepidiphila TaxID=2315841 RepID=UPI000E5C401D|nr:dienelactone hydrolase family protein [Caldimonas tepidiphila]